MSKYPYSQQAVCILIHIVTFLSPSARVCKYPYSYSHPINMHLNDINNNITGEMLQLLKYTYKYDIRI